jgi:hypothetical protein
VSDLVVVLAGRVCIVISAVCIEFYTVRGREIKRQKTEGVIYTLGHKIFEHPMFMIFVYD